MIFVSSQCVRPLMVMTRHSRKVGVVVEGVWGLDGFLSYHNLSVTVSEHTSQSPEWPAAEIGVRSPSKSYKQIPPHLGPDSDAKDDSTLSLAEPLRAPPGPKNNSETRKPWHVYREKQGNRGACIVRNKEPRKRTIDSVSPPPEPKTRKQCPETKKPWRATQRGNKRCLFPLADDGQH